MKPNILVLLAEDMCPNLGCYGDLDAKTPNLDKLASDGVRYTHASSVAPVCSAARTTLALGVYPFTAGVGNHRSFVKLPENINVVSKYMIENGYFTSISKTDLNFVHNEGKDFVEDWSCRIAGDFRIDSETVSQEIANAWRKRGNKPFYFVSTFAVTHQSKYGKDATAQEHRKNIVKRCKPEEYQDRSKLHIPPYHPDNADTREIYGQYLETITAMDKMVGETIELLKNDNLYEDTIIIFAGDNGMGIPGGKANMWLEGCNVPFIVHIPEKWKNVANGYCAGTVNNSAVEFVDIAPTVIRIAGGEIPKHLQGKDFLRDTDFRKYSFGYRNRIDGLDEFVRSVRSNEFIYIRNFYPERGWRFSPCMLECGPRFTTSWERDVKANDDMSQYTRRTAYYLDEKPIEELYDLKKDPYQLHNIAKDCNYSDVLLTMRKELINFMLRVNDLGFIPEQLANSIAREKNSTVHTIGQDKEIYPIEKAMLICNKMLTDEKCDEQVIRYLLDDSNPIIRYWAVEYVRYFNMQNAQDGIELLPKLESMLNDSHRTVLSHKTVLTDDSVSLIVAESLLNMTTDCDIVEKAVATISKLLDSQDVISLMKTTNSLNRLDKKNVQLAEKVQDIVNSLPDKKNMQNERYIQAISNLSSFYIWRIGKDSKYQLDENTKKVLELLTQLREKADL